MEKKEIGNSLGLLGRIIHERNDPIHGRLIFVETEMMELIAISIDSFLYKEKVPADLVGKGILFFGNYRDNIAKEPGGMEQTIRLIEALFITLDGKTDCY
jgi:hypothetical protein